MRDLKDYQEKYKAEPGEAIQVKFRRKHILSIMNRYQHKNVLEVGCGLEPLFLHMSDYDTMTIVEPGEQFINNAMQRAAESRVEICCIQGLFEESVEKIINLGHDFDYIVVSSLLHELENPDLLMESLKKISGNDTIIHINVSNSNSLHRLIAKGMGLIKDEHELSEQQQKMQRHWVYDINSLCDYVSKMGFDVVEKGSFFPKFLTGAQMDRMLAEGIVDDRFFDGLDSLTECLPEYGSEIYVQLKRNMK